MKGLTTFTWIGWAFQTCIRIGKRYVIFRIKGSLGRSVSAHPGRTPRMS
jgi:hypothetical protein